MLPIVLPIIGYHCFGGLALYAISSEDKLPDGQIPMAIHAFVGCIDAYLASLHRQVLFLDIVKYLDPASRGELVESGAIPSFLTSS